MLSREAIPKATHIAPFKPVHSDKDTECHWKAPSIRIKLCLEKKKKCVYCIGLHLVVFRVPSENHIQSYTGFVKPSCDRREKTVAQQRQPNRKIIISWKLIASSNLAWPQIQYAGNPECWNSVQTTCTWDTASCLTAHTHKEQHLGDEWQPAILPFQLRLGPKLKMMTNNIQLAQGTSPNLHPLYLGNLLLSPPAFVFN